MIRDTPKHGNMEVTISYGNREITYGFDCYPIDVADKVVSDRICGHDSDEAGACDPVYLMYGDEVVGTLIYINVGSRYNYPWWKRLWRKIMG